MGEPNGMLSRFCNSFTLVMEALEEVGSFGLETKLEAGTDSVFLESTAREEVCGLTVRLEEAGCVASLGLPTNSCEAGSFRLISGVAGIAGGVSFFFMSGVEAAAAFAVAALVCLATDSESDSLESHQVNKIFILGYRLSFLSSLLSSSSLLSFHLLMHQNGLRKHQPESLFSQLRCRWRSQELPRL